MKSVIGPTLLCLIAVPAHAEGQTDTLLDCRFGHEHVTITQDGEGGYRWRGKTLEAAAALDVTAAQSIIVARSDEYSGEITLPPVDHIAQGTPARLKQTRKGTQTVTQGTCGEPL
ncbi:hypothetical protein ERN12_03335 [Rhodobacteraceae bacterium]|nr:hypothetical protein ERN12_03335 [Paracoccaceae bacterium]